ncbi:MAG TPA: CBS domain-containing protein [Gemmatimonadaceae bacterium]
MKLRDVLATERTIVPLPATTLEGAAAALLERLVVARGVLDEAKLRRRVSEVRREDVAAMGDRAFLLHYRTDAVGQLLVAVGVAAEPIRQQVNDEERSARVVLMVVTPPRFAARYLQVVAAFARMLRKPEALAAVYAAPDAASMLELDNIQDIALPEQLAVRDVMSYQPRTIRADASLREAARLLARTGLGALPVVDDDERVLGMLTEREVIRHLVTTQAFTGPDVRASFAPGMAPKTVREAMTRQVLCVASEQPLAEVASLMSNKDVDKVPVVREGRLIGFLTRGDIVRKLIGS